MVRKVKDRAAIHGYSPEHDWVRETPPTHVMKGTSTLHRYPEGDPEGKILRWDKVNLKFEQQLEVMEQIVHAMKEDVTPIKQPALKRTKQKVNTDVIPWIQIGDSHIGMMAHECQVGHDFNLEIAEREFCKAV